MLSNIESFQPKVKVCKLVHFHVENPNMQESALNKMRSTISGLDYRPSYQTTQMGPVDKSGVSYLTLTVEHVDALFMHCTPALIVFHCNFCAPRCLCKVVVPFPGG